MQKNTYLDNITYKSNNQINYLSGGINNVYPAQSIQDNECQDMYNMCLDKYPAIRTRVGRTMLKNPRTKRNKDYIFWNSRNKIFVLYPRK